MFTGIIESIGVVKALIKDNNILKIYLTLLAPSVDLKDKIGDSIAINGACLTITSIEKENKENSTCSFDVTIESTSRTTLNTLKVGDKVNVERALTLNTRLGGHIVQGHIDGIGKIVKVTKQEGQEGSVYLHISASTDIVNMIVEKGSVTLDGVSLTVAKVDYLTSTFSICLIPHTAKKTTLLNKKAGDSINIETDIIGKYLYHLVNLGNSTSNKDDKDAALMQWLLTTN